jgi:hypothetical protein
LASILASKTIHLRDHVPGGGEAGFVALFPPETAIEIALPGPAGSHPLAHEISHHSENTKRIYSFQDPVCGDGGSHAAGEVESNLWALIAGDADGDGGILPADKLIWQTQSE